jgi:ABC-type Mn2+/Zn2+ transport system ATPase subunit
VIDELVDAEVCEVATEARAILLKALGEGRALVAEQPAPFTVGQIEKEMLKALESVLPAGLSAGSSMPLCTYAAQMCAHLVVYDAPPVPVVPGAVVEVREPNWRELVAQTRMAQWKDCTVPYFLALLGGDAAAATVHERAARSRTATAIANASGSLEEKSSSNAGAAEPEIAAAAMAQLNLSPSLRSRKQSRTGSDLSVVPSAASASPQERADRLASLMRIAALGGVVDSQADTDEDGADLCNIEFSLAFGGKILLHNTYLKLGRGRRYGVMGKNGAGKTTLLTNIGTGNIEGLPTTIKTVYVQHDDSSDDFGKSVVEELVASKDLEGSGVTAQEAADALLAINFTQEMISSPRSCLSGGWKMKLLIIKAMLSKADVLLLDEPTNHLDTASVNWLTDYLLSLSEVTCLIVSHDTGFMDRVLTDVIHYENKKLVYYHGNLTHFVR